MAHINVMPKTPGEGIEDWRSLMARLRAAPHVIAAAPALYSPVLIAGAVNSKAGILKGIDVDSELAISDTLRHLKEGSLDRLSDPGAKPPGILLGKHLVDDTGIRLRNRIQVLSPEGGDMDPRYPRLVLLSWPGYSRAASMNSTTATPSRPSARCNTCSARTTWSTPSN
jgi:ABC-type lipoprotein release transport system permease subunit